MYAGWGVAGMWIGGPVVIIVVFLGGELGPRALAARRPVKLALAAAPALRSLSRVFGRLLFPLLALGRLFSRGHSRAARAHRTRCRPGRPSRSAPGKASWTWTSAA